MIDEEKFPMLSVDSKWLAILYGLACKQMRSAFVLHISGSQADRRLSWSRFGFESSSVS